MLKTMTMEHAIYNNVFPISGILKIWFVPYVCLEIVQKHKKYNEI